MIEVDILIEKLIKRYVDKITINDVYDFALKENIKLNDNEAKIIYSYIKNNWKEIIFDDYKPILEKAKPNLNSETYLKIEELIIKFKNKYKSYL